MADSPTGASTAPADLPATHAVRWLTVALVAGVAVLVAVSFVLTHPERAPGTHAGGAAIGALSVVVTVVVPVVVLVVAAYAFWRFQLDRLARKPGPIQVHAFDDRTEPDGTVDATRSPVEVQATTALAERCAAGLQRHLLGTQLYGPTAIPAAGRSSAFLQVVEHAGSTVRGPWGAASRFVRVLAPASSYEVRCTMLPAPVRGPAGAGEDDERGGPEAENRLPADDRTLRHPCVLQVELTRVPKAVLAPTEIHAPTWDQAVERAAEWIAASVLPRTTQCVVTPWTMWRGLRLPSELFSLYQRFQSERADRRFDEAMGTLDLAILRDPSNLALRLERGKLQERMGMYLDALKTYDDIVAHAARRSRLLAYLVFGDPREPHRPWRDAVPVAEDRGTDAGRPGGYDVGVSSVERAAAAERKETSWHDTRRGADLPPSHPVVHVARYRYAVMLGMGERVAAEWWSDFRPSDADSCRDGCEHPSRRQDERAELRRVLARRFGRRYERQAARVDDLLGGAELLARRGLDRYLPDDVRSDRLEEVDLRELRIRRGCARIFVTSTAVWEAEQMFGERVSGGLDPVRFRRQREVVPRKSLQLFLPWAVLRRGQALAAATADVAADDRVAVALLVLRAVEDEAERYPTLRADCGLPPSGSVAATVCARVRPMAEERTQALVRAAVETLASDGDPPPPSIGPAVAAAIRALAREIAGAVAHTAATTRGQAAAGGLDDHAVRDEVDRATAAVAHAMVRVAVTTGAGAGHVGPEVPGPFSGPIDPATAGRVILAVAGVVARAAADAATTATTTGAGDPVRGALDAAGAVADALADAAAEATAAATARTVHRATGSMLFPTTWHMSLRHLETLLSDGWPASLDELRLVVNEIMQPERRTLHSWHEHYIAACAYALLLLPAHDDAEPGALSSDRLPERDAVVQAALAQLEKAAACSDSGFLATQRDWLLSEDPDLYRLRSAEDFRAFEASTFGAARDAVWAGHRLVEWEQITYVSRLVRDVARIAGAAWRTDPPPATRVAALAERPWMLAELRLWELVDRLAVDWDDWRTRRAVAIEVRDWSGARHDTGPSLRHPSFSEEELGRQRASLLGVTAAPGRLPVAEVPVHVGEVVDRARLRLTTLADLLRGNDEGSRRCARALGPRPALLFVTGTPADAALVDAAAHAAAWDALATWFDDSGRRPFASLDDRRAAFVAARSGSSRSLRDVLERAREAG